MDSLYILSKPLKSSLNSPCPPSPLLQPLSSLVSIPWLCCGLQLYCGLWLPAFPQSPGHLPLHGPGPPSLPCSTSASPPSWTFFFCEASGILSLKGALSCVLCVYPWTLLYFLFPVLSAISYCDINLISQTCTYSYNGNCCCYMCVHQMSLSNKACVKH